MGRLLVFVAVGVLLLAAVTGCGGDDEVAEPQVVEVEVTPSGEGRFKLEAPESVEAGLVRLEFRNGTKDSAEAFLARIDEGHTVQELLDLIGSDDPKIPDYFHAVGGVGQTKPGKSGVVELVLEEGTYHIVDTGSPDGDDTESHAENGAVATLEVEGGDDDAELPEVDAKIEMADYSFVTEGLKAGTNRFLLQNTGDELHHTIVFPIREGATSAEVREFLTSDGSGDGPPPFDVDNITGTTTLDSGREQIDQLTFAAGRYALVCFITDRAGGPPHVAKGMLREITIPAE